MSYELTIEPLGRTIEVEEGQSILDAALRAGIYLPHACAQGYCATCKVCITEGTVEHGNASSFALMEFEREEGQALACCATLESDATLSVEMELDEDARNIPVRDFSCVVSRIDPLTPTIKGIWLQLPDGETLDFQAGQYIQLHLPHGLGHRAFSLANPPGQGENTRTLELHVRLVPAGTGTTWLHQELKVGDTLTVSGPYGRFFVHKSAHTPSLFIAGGSGLSSPRSMLLDLLQEGNTLPLTLVYGARHQGELYYHEEFIALSQQHPHFTYVPTLSNEPEDSTWTGHRGHAHEAAKAHFNNDFRGHKAYLCGPPVMIDACITTLMQGRLFERDIYTEKFFSAADAQQVRSPLFKRL